MPDDHPAKISSKNDGRAWTVVLAVVIGVTLLRLLWLALLSPLTLIEDEAHYWEWSRRLDWSYYSKGPGVGWLIALSTSLLGDNEFGVRAPAAIWAAIGAVGSAGLARSVFRDRRVLLPAAVCWLAIPAFQPLAVLMTIDGPYVACYTLAAWAAWHALTRRSGPAWLGLGACFALAFIFKYTAALIPPALLAFALLRPRRLRPAGAGWIAAGMLLGLAGLAPVIIWNAQHDWDSLRHLLGHLGVEGGDVRPSSGDGRGWSPLWPLEYLGIAIGAGSPTLLLALMGMRNAAIARRERRPRGIRGGVTYLLCLSLAPLAFYAVISLFTRVEANWHISAYGPLAALAGWAAVEGAARRDAGVRVAWHACVITLAVCLLALPAITIARATAFDPPLVPLGRASGMRELSSAADDRLRTLREETGLEPFVMTIHYGRASQLAFYLQGRPTTYASSSHFGDGRRTQYDIWEATDLARLDVNQRLLDRPALLFSGVRRDWERVFERVEPIDPLPGENKPDRQAFVAYGFRGFPPDLGGPDGLTRESAP
ncbi:MAG: glycosyltransferase family 39 protein [Planctomycetota bacterium]